MRADKWRNRYGGPTVAAQDAERAWLRLPPPPVTDLAVARLHYVLALRRKRRAERAAEARGEDPISATFLHGDAVWDAVNVYTSLGGSVDDIKRSELHPDGTDAAPEAPE